ncbi:hypothetical protein D3C87_1487040 [compost metagenome]
MQQWAVLGQSGDQIRILGTKTGVGKGLAQFAHQPIPDMGCGIFDQQQLGWQGEERQADLTIIPRHHQFDPGVAQPVILLQQSQYQRKQGTVHYLHLQPLEAGASEQDAGQIS